ALRADIPPLSVRDCPALAPILMTVAALSHGATLTDTARLKLKESDRGRAMAQELAKCGIRTIQEENSITVLPGMPVPPSEPLFGHNDHRIVMALAVLLTRVGGVIRNAEAVTKSYPEFFDHLAALQIKVETDKRNA
ncbi:MAG: 3-phosphoshikimate 1-carboxyvinyltransferase, partial [Eubacteriales bacterium]